MKEKWTERRREGRKGWKDENGIRKKKMKEIGEEKGGRKEWMKRKKEKRREQVRDRRKNERKNGKKEVRKERRKVWKDRKNGTRKKEEMNG